MPWNWNSFPYRRIMAQCTNVRCQMFMLTTVNLLKVITALPFDVKSKENISIFKLCPKKVTQIIDCYKLLEEPWLLRIYFTFNLLTVLKKNRERVANLCQTLMKAGQSSFVIRNVVPIFFVLRSFLKSERNFSCSDLHALYSGLDC